MRKTSVLIITLLSVLLCAVVVWQWVLYSNDVTELVDERDKTMSQHVLVTVEQKEMTIKQVFSNLDAGELYSATVPKDAVNFSCTIETGEPCEVSNTPYAVKATGSELQFEYSLPFQPSAEEILMNNWLVLLKDLSFINTKVEIVDKLHKKGTWVTGIPFKGFKQKELVGYSVFEGRGSNPSLYWQNRSLVSFSDQEGFSYYESLKPKTGTYKFNNLAGLAENQHLSVVFTSKGHLVRGSGLLLIDGAVAKNDLEKQIAISLLLVKFPGLPAKENWLLEAFASMITNQPATGKKGQTMIREMQDKLTAEEVNRLIRYIVGSHSNLDQIKLDEQLSRMKGLKTRFFVLNRANDSGLYPLLFIESRSMIANGRKISSLDIVLDGEKRLFPFLATMKSLGYEARAYNGSASIQVKKGSIQYSFNLKNKTYTMNGNRYGLLENPFRNINGTTYVEKAWLEAIFKMSIKESEDEIILSL